MKFLYKILTIFSINLIYSSSDIKSFYELCEALEKTEKNNTELKQQTKKLNQDITNLKSKLYISENRFNDKKKDHERAIKDKDSEIAKFKKKSWATKAYPFLICTLSLILIFVVMRIYFTLYPLRTDSVLN